VACIFLDGFPLKFVSILLQSISVGRLRKAGGKATGTLCLSVSVGVEVTSGFHWMD